MKPLQGKIALITGAGSGIGRGIAERFAREGAMIILADINSVGMEETARAIAQDTLQILLDVSQISSIEQMVTTVINRYGHIDIFVNSAGVVKSCDLLEVTEQDWDMVIDINQKGTAFTNKLVGSAMVEHNRPVQPHLKCRGKILNFSSIAGRRGRAFQLHYAASKAAVISITQSAALKFAPYGICVNAISPSVVETPMWNDHVSQKAQTYNKTTTEIVDEMVANIPLGRAGTIEDIASAALFLCSDQADFITGQTLNVDGGFEMN